MFHELLLYLHSMFLILQFHHLIHLILQLEFQLINHLDHKNIIKAFDVSFGDSTHPPAILLEYCASNLKKKIKKLTESERINAIVDISSAMKEVHSIGLIHRDLKQQYQSERLWPLHSDDT